MQKLVYFTAFSKDDSLVGFLNAVVTVKFFAKVTPRKINMEHNHGGLEDHFPF